jgi:hypothetical protein
MTRAPKNFLIFRCFPSFFRTEDDTFVLLFLFVDALWITAQPLRNQDRNASANHKEQIANNVGRNKRTNCRIRHRVSRCSTRAI